MNKSRGTGNKRKNSSKKRSSNKFGNNDNKKRNSRFSANDYKKRNPKQKDFSRKKSAGKITTIEATCVGMDNEGRGLIKHEDRMLKVPNLIKDEVAKVNLIRSGRYTDCEVVEITSPSQDRAKPKCKYYYECGGCQLQHMSLKGQNEYKEIVVRKAMKEFGKVAGLISMEQPYDYRNKIHTTFATFKGGQIVSGFYQEYSHKVVKIDRCIIQDPRADEIILTLRDLAKSFKLRIYEEDRDVGFLRHALIRTGKVSGEIMLVLVVTDRRFPSKNNFIKALLKKHPEITTVVMNINDKDTSMVLGDREEVMYGKGFIEDQLCGHKFHISPKSFYQVNPVQTEKLYNKAIELADLKGTETIIDAYSGIGTISLIASSKVKEVIGVELNKDAFKNSIKNAKINKIKNARFFNADAGEFMVEVAQEGLNIDAVFLDPPRSGSDEKFLSSVVKLSPKKVVYISCNPVTQARDLKFLVDKGYKVKKIQPVDMFPWTYHVENIVLLEK
jgi:23S rRNA (uracil1939-C5)-methyltransferase